MSNELDKAISKLYGLLVTTFNYNGYTESGVYWSHQVDFKKDHKFYSEAIEIILKN